MKRPSQPAGESGSARDRSWVGLAAVLNALTLRYYQRHPAAALLCFLGVALGVGAGATINLTVERAVDSFTENIRQISGRAELRLEFAQPMQTSALTRLRDLWSVAWFSPYVHLRAADAHGPVDLYGFDFVGDRRIRRFGQPAGRPDTPAAHAAPAVFRGLVIAPNSPLGKPGGTLFLSRNGRRESYLVTGTLPSLNGRAPPERAAFADLAVLLPRAGGITGVDFLPRPGHATDADRERLRAELVARFPGARVTSARQRAGETRSLLAAFRMNLRALAAIAVLVSAYLIYNTMHLTALRRTPEVQTLYALGADPRTLRLALLAEGGLFAALGGLPGMLLAVPASGRALADTAVTMGTVFGLSGSVAPGTGFGGALLVYLLAIPAGVLSAWAPAAELARRSVARGLRRGATEYRSGTLRRTGWWTLGASLLTVALATGAVLFSSAAPGLIAVPAALVAVSCLAPLVLLLIGGVCTHARAPAVLRLAGSMLRSHVRKAGVAAAALAIALALSGSVATLVASFRTTVDAWLATVIRADIYISSADSPGAPSGGGLPEEVRQILRTRPATREVLSLRMREASLRGETVIFRGHDFDVLRRLNSFSLVEGRAADLRSGAEPRVAVSEVFANRHGLKRGDHFSFEGHRFTIVAVARVFSSSRGVIMMDQRLFDRVFGPGQPIGLAVVLKDGVDAATALDGYRDALRSYALDYALNRSIRRQALEIFDRTFRITDILRFIAFATASLSIVTTLLAVALERRRDLAVLVALGTGRAVLQLSLLTESLLLAAAGIVASIPGTIALSYLLVYIINRYSFGWTIVLDVPWGALLSSLGWILLFALLAAVYPLVVAAGRRPIEALREE